MRKYKLIKHTADIGIVALGESLPEAFAIAAEGMFSIITDLRRVRLTRSNIITVKAKDTEGLLFEWLNELIYLFDTEYLLIKRCETIEFDGTSLKAICRGERYDPARHELKLGIKSATYYLLEVDREHNQVQVFFDV